MPKAPVAFLGRVPAVPATQKYINGQGPDLLCVTLPYALFHLKAIYVVDLPILAKSLINERIRLRVSTTHRVVLRRDLTETRINSHIFTQSCDVLF